MPRDLDEADKNIRDLKALWRNRYRMDRQVTGAIELAYRRGYQAGLEANRNPRKRAPAPSEGK